MSFEKLIRIPNDRIAVLIGKSGNVKSKIEKLCHVSLDIDGDTGEVLIKSQGDVEKIQPFKSMEIVTAIGRGFSPENALTLLKGENALHVIDLREFAGKSNANVERIKGRIIGEGGRARQNMEILLVRISQFMEELFQLLEIQVNYDWLLMQYPPFQVEVIMVQYILN